MNHVRAHPFWFYAFLCPLMIGLLAVPVGAPAAEKTTLKKTVLPNGVTVILKENHTVPLIAAQVFVRSGLLQEPADRAGLAHFTHTLLLKGTTHRSAQEIAETIESLGGSLTASVEPDFSNLSLVILKENFGIGLDVLLDILKHASFPKEEVDKERKNLLLALKGRYDDPFTEAYDLLRKAMYGNHPYGRPAIGEEKVISTLPRDALVSFYREQFNGPNLIFCFVGDFDTQSFLKTIKPQLAAIPVSAEERWLQTGGMAPLRTEAHPIAARETPNPSPSTKPVAVRKTRADLNASWTLFGYLGPATLHPDYPTAKVLHSIIGGGMSSKLFVSLRDQQGLAYALGSFFPTRKAQSMLVLYAQSSPANQAALEAGIETEVANLPKILNDPEDLTAKKRALIGEYLARHQSMSSQAWHLGWWTLLGRGIEFDAAYPDAIRRVTSRDLIRFAKQTLQHPARVILNPKSPPTP